MKERSEKPLSEALAGKLGVPADKVNVIIDALKISLGQEDVTAFLSFKIAERKRDAS